MPPGTRDLSPPLRVTADVVGAPVAAVLGAVALARRAKSLHPRGVTYEATLAISGARAAPAGAALLAERAEHRAIVRFSRSIGLPAPLPDLLGVSLRVPDAYGPGCHQDILAVTSVDAPVLHHLFVPAADAQDRPYSTSLPYAAAGERFILGVLPRADSPRREGADERERLASAAATGELAFDLAVAPLGGRFTPVGRLAIGDPAPATLEALRFNPGNCGGGLEPVGVLNRMRDLAYPLSQRGWRRSMPAGARRQAEAEAELVELGFGEADNGHSAPSGRRPQGPSSSRARSGAQI